MNKKRVKDKYKKRGNKKAQEIFGLSFGMIFAIILIIFFIVVAFIAISQFLKVKKCAQVGLFINDLQDEVEKMWRTSGETTFNGTLPSGIKKVCFSNLTINFNGPDKDIGYQLDIDPEKNMFLIPLNYGCDMAENNIKYIDVTYISSTKNPYCFDVVNGKVKIIIYKDSNEKLVKIR